MKEKDELTAEEVRELIRETFGTKRGSLAQASRETGAHLSHIYNFMHERYDFCKTPPKALLNYLGIKVEVVYRKKDKK